MAEEPTAAGARSAPASPELEAGNYEVIRARLVVQGRELGVRLEALNQKRKHTFGGTELEVIGNPRIRTKHNCVPRDIVQVGGHLLFGYEVFIGLKSETKVGDVLSVHDLVMTDDDRFDCPPDPSAGPFLEHEGFVDDFSKLYRYTRDARLLRLVKTDHHLFAVFQVGSTFVDDRAFRWRLQGDGRIEYVDDRGDRAPDYARPPARDFEWKVPDIEWQLEGKHVRIHDHVFVSNLDSRLTLRVEDNTATGQVVFSEPVDDANQGISDLGVGYAMLGPLVLLELTPFRETSKRYVVYNRKTRAAQRLDAIGQACQALPEEHGIIFPGGYYLATGEYKLFDHVPHELEFVRKIVSPNGEDVLYVYHRRRDGHYVLFPYNLIRKEVQTPIHCHGYSLFDDGRMVVFKAQNEEPTTMHPMQVWDTPFTSAAFAAAAPTDGSFLANVGNAELVRGISDGYSIVRLVENARPTRQIYDDLVRSAARVLDAYYWLDHAEVGDLRSVLAEVHQTAELVIDEFEKVELYRQQALSAVSDTEARLLQLGRDLRTEHWRQIDPFLEALTSLRSLRGHIISQREIRYIDRARLDELEGETQGHFDRVSKASVSFLLRDEALSPLDKDLEGTLASLGAVTKVAEVTPLKQRLDDTAEGLRLLSDVVANLQVDDATDRTRILTGIGEVFAHLNRVRATVEGRRRELSREEGRAEFAAQFALLGQGVASALALCDTPEKCDEELSRILVQLEDLEGRFGELDEFLDDLTAKREEIHDAFGAKRQQLLDERQRRVQNLASAADRILDGVGRRSRALGSNDELNAYFASDAMVMKVRQIAGELTELGDTVKAEGIASRLKSTRQDAQRGLRDKLELFEEGDVIKLGRHRFSVTSQRLELTVVPRGEGMALHLTGTELYQPIDDADFAQSKRFWSQTLPSENDAVYRGEYLAACILDDAERSVGGLDLGALRRHQREHTLGELTRRYAQDRYDEGYDRGLHDADAALILDKLLVLCDAAGLLRFSPGARALGTLFWQWQGDAEAARRWHLQAQSLGRLRQSLGHTDAVAALAGALGRAIAAFAARERLGELGIGAPEEAAIAGAYLFEELCDASPHFAVSAEATALVEALLRHLDLHGDRRAFDDDMRAFDDKLHEKLSLARAWLGAFIAATEERRPQGHLVIEAAALLCSRSLARETESALGDARVEGLLGQHARIEGGKLTLRVDEFLGRLGHFRHHEVPAYREYRKLRHGILERERAKLRLDEYTPRVMTAFVRNRLINDVYLPLVGDNLAKQIGATGEGKRTDLMGLLLLVSPPGYGKTTLMEYIASRLGLVFVKVNGPALGHGVVSLDPAEAPNATARQEVDKINLALEMGTNVMLYLDDIQHTNPELLQKFISLCDAQRRIEGVWQGRTRTYDLRGKKLCVVMAGNPYTESGEKFQIPDMLANRADTYNLGDILEGKHEAFALSFVENALTSNPALAPLATREQADVYKLIRMAQGEQIPASELSHGYSPVELTEIAKVLSHLLRVQRTLLLVNQMYIESASQDDRFRTEPPFRLQGSYRNMNRIAEKIASAMNEDEVERLVTDHYDGESQTLTTGAEHNLLKLAELRGTLDDAGRARWAAIKAEYVRHKRMGGGADDPVTRVTGTLSGLGEDLGSIRAVLAEGSQRGLAEHLAKLSADLGSIREALVAAAEGYTAAHPPEPEYADLEASPRVGRAERLAGREAWLTPYLLRIEAALEALGRPQVQVQTSPRLEGLLEQHTALLEQVLLPLARRLQPDEPG